MVFFRQLPNFNYFAPDTLDEALVRLNSRKSTVKILAGGTDLLVNLKNRTIEADDIVSIRKIKCLDYIQNTNSLKFGALTTLDSLENSVEVRKRYPILVQAIKTMASLQIRNIATAVGNICSASPAADTATPLIVLDAKVKLSSANGTRSVPVSEYFVSPGLTISQSNEIVIEVEIPEVKENSSGTFIKFGLRNAMSLSVVNVAVLVNIERGYCEDIRIALGAVAPTPFRAIRAENVLRGKKPSQSLFNKVAEISAEDSKPISDFRASSSYRRELIQVLVGRALKQLFFK